MVQKLKSQSCLKLSGKISLRSSKPHNTFHFRENFAGYDFPYEIEALSLTGSVHLLWFSEFSVKWELINSRLISRIHIHWSFLYLDNLAGVYPFFFFPYLVLTELILDFLVKQNSKCFLVRLLWQTIPSWQPPSHVALRTKGLGLFGRPKSWGQEHSFSHRYEVKTESWKLSFGNHCNYWFLLLLYVYLHVFMSFNEINNIPYN